MLALPIFPASHPASIVGEGVLNFCVRDGNRWTHTPINTNYIFASENRSWYIVQYRLLFVKEKIGDPYRIRTDVNGVRGRCLNHLTNGPHLYCNLQTLKQRVNLNGAPSGTRTRDLLIKSQPLYQLS